MVFDTHESSEEMEKFIEKDDIPHGQIIVAACKDDCVSEFSEKCKKWFVDLGSIEIESLEKCQSFAFIGISGKKDAKERRGHLEGEEAAVQ